MKATKGPTRLSGGKGTIASSSLGLPAPVVKIEK